MAWNIIANAFHSSFRICHYKYLHKLGEGETECDTSTSDIDFIRQKHECNRQKHIRFLVTNKEAGLELNDGKLKCMVM